MPVPRHRGALQISVLDEPKEQNNGHSEPDDDDQSDDEVLDAGTETATAVGEEEGEDEKEDGSTGCPEVDGFSPHLIEVEFVRVKRIIEVDILAESSTGIGDKVAIVVRSEGAIMITRTDLIEWIGLIVEGS